MTNFKKTMMLFAVLTMTLLIVVGSASELYAGGEKLDLEYANNFSIELLEDDLKRVVDSDGVEFILVPRDDDIPQKYEDSNIIKTPVEDVMLTTTVHASLLRPLDVFDNIEAVTRKEDRWHIEELAEGLRKDSITYVGDPDSPDYELIETINPEVVFLTTPSYLETKEKLNELGHTTVSINAGYEDHPLGRMEAIKALGAFFDRLEEAEEYFASSVESLDEVLERIPEEERPEVVMGRNFQGGPNISEGGNYAARMIEMAGGDYAFQDIGPESSGFADISLEKFYERGVDAELFLYNFSFVWEDSLEGLQETAPILRDLKAVEEENVWYYQPWFFQSVDLTHEIIEDMAFMLYPDIFEDEEVRHFRPLE